MIGKFLLRLNHTKRSEVLRKEIVSGISLFLSIGGMFGFSAAAPVCGQDLVPTQRGPIVVRNVELDLFDAESHLRMVQLDRAEQDLEYMTEHAIMMVADTQSDDSFEGTDVSANNDTRSSSFANAEAGTADRQSPIETFGEAPVDRTEQFLRQVTPLLAKGQFQFDCGLIYTLQEYNFPVLAPGPGVVRANIRRRSINVPLAMRYGWNEQTQLFINAPVGWSNSEIGTPFGDDGKSASGIGDVQFGFNRLLHQNSKTGKSIVGSLRASAPTGNPTNPLIITQAGTGNGVWRLGGDLLAIQNLDPVILFYGAGYVYSFEKDFSGYDVQLGQQFTYNLGLGFAANERLTLSTAFQGSYITKTRVDGRQLANSDLEPLQIRMAATISRCKRIVEPFVTFGLTQTSPSAQLGVIFTR